MRVSEHDQNKLRLALKIISGRLSPGDLDTEDYGFLGYDTYRFGYYGKPDGDEVIRKCEEIIFYMIVPLQDYD